VPAIVTGLARGAAQVRLGSYTAEIVPEGFAGPRRTSAARLVRPGDLVDVRVVELDPATMTVTATLEQEPEVEGALIAIENRTGRIISLVGGFSFERSKFNRATQAYRQMGSLFKVILYTAAIDRGYTASSMLLDEPASFEVGPGQPLYQPTNYDSEYKGPITLRHALEDSRNLPAVRMLAQIGPESAVEYAKRLGFTSSIPPFLSIALGSAEATLLEVTSAYSAFPNRGIRMTPYLIEKVIAREGDVQEQNLPQAQDSIRADTAYIMVSLLRGVIERGTGTRARSLNWPLGGKTGTVDDYTDAWFVGFDPEITVGVWVGFDQKRTLGDRQQGSAVALPIWIEFMKAYIGDRTPTATFDPPSNVVFVPVDPKTGRVTDYWTPGAIQEAFIAGTQAGVVLQP
jgi:penicillin-binding protein 1A